MSINYDDEQFAWRLKTRWLTFRMLSGLLSSAGVDASEGAGGAVHAAIGLAASELTCIQIGAAADEIYHFEPLWDDLDTAYDVRVKIWFIHSATDADTPDWLFSYKLYADQDALTDCTSSGDGAIALAAKTVSTTDDSVETTDWISLAFTSAYASGDIAWAFAVECNGLGSASANEIEFVGVQFQYVPMFMSGNQVAGQREKL